MISRDYSFSWCTYGRMNTKVRRQEKLDMAKERDFRRGELLE